MTLPARLKILIVDPSGAVTGGFRYSANTARLMSPWADVSLVLPAGSAIPSEELTMFSEVTYLPLVQLRKAMRNILLYLPGLLWNGMRLRNLVHKRDIDCIIAVDFFQIEPAVARLLGYRGKILSWVRMSPAHFPNLISGMWLRAHYANATWVLAVSKNIEAVLPPSPKLLQVYDPCMPGPDIDEENWFNDRRSQDLIYIGNYIRGKGQEHAIRAFARLADRFPEARLSFYGGDMGLQKNREFRAELRELAAELGLADRVQFNGFTSDVPAVLQAGGVSLNFSEAEALSYSCIEASMFGLPQVATRCGGPEEIIVDGKTGFLVDKGDEDGAVEAIGRLLENADLARSMGVAGARHVRVRFSPDGYVERMLSLIEHEATHQNAC